MEVLFLILPFALLIAIAFVVAFIYAVKKGHFDDMETPAVRMLIDDENIQTKEELK